jgi:hypothetical protein
MQNQATSQNNYAVPGSAYPIFSLWLFTIVALLARGRRQ